MDASQARIIFKKLHTSPVNWSIEIAGIVIASGDTILDANPSFLNKAILLGEHLDFIIYTSNYGTSSTEIIADFEFDDLSLIGSE